MSTKITVFLKVGKQQMTIIISEDATVGELHIKVAEKVKFDQEKLRIVTGTHQLRMPQDKDKKLTEFEIVDQSDVYIVQRAPGGSLSTQRSSMTMGRCILTRKELPVSNLIKMSCGHTFSLIALVQYLDVKISKSNELVCPAPSCKKDWTKAELSKSGITEAKIKEVLDSMITNMMFTLFNYKRCPQCKILTELINEGRTRIKCLFCSQTKTYEFCWSCLKEWKDVKSNSKCGNKDCDPASSDVLRYLETCVEKEIVGFSTKVPEIRACPHCGMLINHESGCKHMVCMECKCEFCFACLSIRKDGKWPESCGGWNTECTVSPRQKELPRK